MFIRETSSNGTAGTTLDRLVSLAESRFTSRSTEDNHCKRIDQGFVRVKTGERNRDRFEDFPFGNSCKLTIDSTLWDALREYKYHVDYNAVIEEREFTVQLKNGDEVSFDKTKAKATKLSFLIATTGVQNGDILHIVSKTKVLTLDKRISLSP